MQAYCFRFFIPGFAWILFICQIPRLAGQEISYEGLKANHIDVAAHPKVEVEKLLPFIVQKAGEPYSNAKVQESMEALNRAGRFSKVRLEIRPEAAGLHLIFVLEPVFYIGLVQFPGAEGSFSYARLVQVVNLGSQEIYTRGLIEEAEGALTHFFQTNGYFTSSVHVETQFDEAHQLANILFHVNLNQRARIGRVEVTGSSTADSNRLRRSTGLKTGKPYLPERIEKARTRLQNYFSRKGRLTSQVRMTGTRFQPDTNRVDVSFEVVPGSLVEVRTSGARVWKRTLRRLIPIFEENTFDHDLVKEGERNLVTHFQGKGYFDVDVDTHIQELPSKIEVEYEVVKGKRHKVAPVSFLGNTYFSAEDLLDNVPIETGGWFSRGRFSDQLVKRSVDNLTALYRNAGFEEVRIQPQVVDEEPHVRVTFAITEGSQTLVKGLRIAGSDRLKVASLLSEGLNLQPGQPFSEYLLGLDRDLILASYLERGYLNARFKWSIERSAANPHQVEVLYIIEEGQQVSISEVVVLGPQQTKPWFINKIANVQLDEPLSQKKLLESESRLYNEGIFDWTNVGPRRPISDQEQEEVLLKVHEARRNTISYGFGFETARRGGSLPGGSAVLPGLPPIDVGNVQVSQSEKTFASPRASFEYTRRNLRGLGETVSLATRLARLQQRGLFTFGDPHFRASQWRSLFSLSGQRTSENPLFTARLFETSLQLERRLKESQTLFLRYGFRRTSLGRLLVPELVLPEDRSIHLSTLSGSWIRDARDKPLDPSRGLYQTLDLGINPKFLGSSAGFVRFLGQMAHYRPLRSSMVWANSLRLGLAKPFGARGIPLSERFFSGGSTSLRGFPTNGAGPQRLVPICNESTNPPSCTNIRVPVGGNALLLLNSELRFPLPIKKGFGAAIFYDGGNVYQRVRLKDFFNNYTHTIGFGFRYNTPIGPIRFDIGRNLNPVAGIKATQFFVTVGPPF